MDLQSEKYGLSFDIKKYTTSCWALGDENVIGIRSFKSYEFGGTSPRNDRHHSLFARSAICG